MDSLVSTDWLASHLDEEDLIVIDASRHLPATGRDATTEYRTAHIPGARFLDLGALADPQSPVGKTLPGLARAAEEFAKLGIDRSHRIVIYDDSDVKTSARAWFILTGYGLPNVAILDGGLAKWKAEGRRVTNAEETAESASLIPQPFSGNVRRKADMLANLDSRAEQVIDARDAARFSGETHDTVHNLPGGHIPGARNIPFRQMFGADGTFLPPDELRKVFDRAGIDLSRPIVTTCGSGVTASVLLFALHLTGVDNGALYDGSWSEWGADPATPKETGPA